MKASGSKVRMIAPLAMICFLVGLSGRLANAQGIPTSGAMLTINGTVNGAPVNIVIYDSQIHSGYLKAVPVGVGSSSCTSADAKYPTDAFVLQGGSWTGCDTGDEFEVTDNNTSGLAHQAAGKADVSGFHIETHYLCSGACTGFPYANFTPACNTSLTICTTASGPDSGFLTVTNNTLYPFYGTITLQGNSNIAGGDFCPATQPNSNGKGVASDQWTNGLAASGDASSVTLALSSDGSNCGGFNATQTQSLTGGQFQFLIGGEIYTVTPFSGATGDKLSLLPIPVPAGPLGIDSWSPGYFGSEKPTYSTSPFSATNYPGQAIIPYADFSAAGNPVGVEFQLECSGSDCNTFLNTTQVDFAIDPLSLPSGIGGAEFLGQHDNNPVGYPGTCPTNGFNVDIFFSYTSTTPDPIKGKTLGNSCFVTTFDPTAAVVTGGNTENQQTFVGFQSPVVNDGPMNVIKAGSAVPLIWQTFNPSGTPVTNLALCGNPTGLGCSTTAPWVFIGTLAINCGSDKVLSNALLSDTAASGNSGLQNMGNGTYQYNLKTVKGATGCFTPVLGFSAGLWSYSVANFQYH